MKQKLQTIVNQFEACEYQCEAGPLEMNTYFQDLKRLARPLTSKIAGVEIKELVTHSDERGFFREIVRVTDSFFAEGFGQWSHSVMGSGVVKAWHIHSSQCDFWHCPIGVLKAVICDRRQGSETFGVIEEYLLGDYHDPIVLKIPPGIAHGCKVLQGPAHLFYITSKVYNPSDEGRIDHDDLSIGYDWLKGPEVK